MALVIVFVFFWIGVFSTLMWALPTAWAVAIGLLLMLVVRVDNLIHG